MATLLSRAATSWQSAVFCLLQATALAGNTRQAIASSAAANRPELPPCSMPIKHYATGYSEITAKNV